MISIIVAIYNVEKYLENCILSIMEQTYTNLQIILVDDGSDDSSGKICDIYQKKDRRICVIHQKQNGLVSARKTGLHYVTGDYVILMDGDDYIETCLCEKMVDIIQRFDVDFVHANYILNDGEVQKNILYDEIFAENNMSMDKKKDIIKNRIWAIGEENNRNNFIIPSIWSKIFKAEFIKKCYQFVPDTQSFGEDLICLCHCIMECKSMLLLKEGYYHYVTRTDSLSTKADLREIRKRARLCDCLENVFIYYNMLDDVKEQLETYYEFMIMNLLKKIQTDTFHINQYYFKEINRIYGKRIFLYGFGQVGKDYYDQICRYQNVEIVGVIDRNYMDIQPSYVEVTGINSVINSNFDYILIAMKNGLIAESVSKELEAYGVPQNKIIWETPGENKF